MHFMLTRHYISDFVHNNRFLFFLLPNQPRAVHVSHFTSYHPRRFRSLECTRSLREINIKNWSFLSIFDYKPRLFCTSSVILVETRIYRTTRDKNGELPKREANDKKSNVKARRIRYRRVFWTNLKRTRYTLGRRRRRFAGILVRHSSWLASGSVKCTHH